jgi:hypothetical protein
LPRCQAGRRRLPLVDITPKEIFRGRRVRLAAWRVRFWRTLAAPLVTQLATYSARCSIASSIHFSESL